MRILVLNGAGGGLAALVQCGPHQVHEHERQEGCRAEFLGGTVRDLLSTARWEPGSLGLIAAVVGPGSFTGLRASLSLAQGLALGSGVPLCGVTLMEALRRSVGDTAGRPLWCVSIARRGRVFLACDEASGVRGCAIEALPAPAAPVLLAGDASALAAAQIALAVPSGVEQPTAVSIAAVALDRHRGLLPAIAALPLYVDAPEALPAAAVRPPPGCQPPG